jgi:tetratricopeptide (TPR) repeat protein
LELAKKHQGPKRQISDIYYDLAGAYRSEDLFPEAYKNIQTAMEIAHQKPPEELSKEHQQTLGFVLEKLDEHDEFLRIFERKILSNDELHGGTIDSLRRSLSRVYTAKGRYDEAMKVLSWNMYNPEMRDEGREHDLPLLAAASALQAEAHKSANKLVESKEAADQSEKYVAESQALALAMERKTHLRAWQRACLALDYAVVGKTTRSAQFIDRQLDVPIDKQPGETVREYRDRLFENLDNDSLCEKASKRIGDEHRAAKCRDHAKQIKNKLIDQGCLPSA